MNKTILIAIICLIVAGAGGFFAGMQYQKSQRSLFLSGNGQFARRFGQSGQNFMPVRGQVLHVDTTTLTVKLPNGNSQIVIVAPSTQFLKSATASQSDITTGSTVMVVGTKNSDGSVTAQDVQINPVMIMRPTGTGQ